MKTKTGEKITHIRPAFGSIRPIRHIKVAGEEYFREAHRADVEFETPLDEQSWYRCGPVPVQDTITL